MSVDAVLCKLFLQSFLRPLNLNVGVSIIVFDVCWDPLPNIPTLKFGEERGGEGWANTLLKLIQGWTDNIKSKNTEDKTMVRVT